MWDHKHKKAQQANAENFTVLGKDVTFKGIAHFEGTVQLDSCFEGEIHTNGVLVVGEHAAITGTINAGTVVSNGKIRGDVTASDKVQLLKSAILIGNVQAPSFSMEEGAYFKGLCEMGANPWLEEPSQNDTSLTVRRDKPQSLLIEADPGS